MQSDSVEKIITRYFATVTKEPIHYDGKQIYPRPLKVSPLLLRGYTCPAFCGGCCFRFTLDYLPGELQPIGTVERKIKFNGRWVVIWTDAQEENEGTRCKHLMKDGRCGIYTVRPFTCDFELIRSLTFAEETRPNVLTQKLFGRGWSYARTDGGKGAKCEMLPADPKTIAEVVRKLKRLQAWADHFELQTWIPDVIRVVENGTLARSGAIVFELHQEGFGL